MLLKLQLKYLTFLFENNFEWIVKGVMEKGMKEIYSLELKCILGDNTTMFITRCPDDMLF